MALHCDLLTPRSCSPAAATCNSCNLLSPACVPVARLGFPYARLRCRAGEGGRREVSVRCSVARKGGAVVEGAEADAGANAVEEEVLEEELFIWRPPFVSELADIPTVAPLEDRRSFEVLYGSWITSGFGNSAAVQSSPPPRQKKEDSHKDEFYLNAGYAIRTLREELPAMFYKDLTYEIYRDDIVFRDPMNTFGGIQNYKLIFGALRFHGKIFFKVLWVDIVRVWQPCENVITVRWTVRGVPRVPWEAQGRFDGTSEYKLDKQGKIYEHKVDNVLLNSPPKFHVKTVLDLVAVAGGHSSPTPTFYSNVKRFIAGMSPYLERFTWVRYYYILICTLTLIDKRDFCNEYSDG